MRSESRDRAVYAQARHWLAVRFKTFPESLRAGPMIRVRSAPSETGLVIDMNCQRGTGIAAAAARSGLVITGGAVFAPPQARTEARMARNGRDEQELLNHDHQEISEPRRGMNRAQLMERILELNPTATPQFLGEFSETSLAHYLEHLCVVNEPAAPWVRRGISPAIVRREARE
jgi:hypothetical protein